MCEQMTAIALIGTGFVADYYMTTLANHPQLRLTGAFDSNPEALRRFSSFHGVRAYSSLDEVLADPSPSIIVNLTTPQSHFEISRRALEAGKHVYSEKPLAMSFGEAQSLVDLARERRLTVASAPANALSPAHSAVAAALSAGEIGEPRLIYAEMEDGPVFRNRWREWRSVSGAPWPGEHEFEIGCTLEHAGYALSWLVSLFGPATSVSAFSALVFADKGQGAAAHGLGPDFSVGSLAFESGPVARVTSGLSAPRDRSLTILGTAGTIIVRDLWDHHSPVRIERVGEKRRLAEKIAARIEKRLATSLPWRPQPGWALPVRKTPDIRLPAFPSKIDFCGGIAAQARAISECRAPFFSGDVALHITEIALALSNAGPEAGAFRPRSSFSFPADASARPR
jgi:predicted dehydrogenase